MTKPPKSPPDDAGQAGRSTSRAAETRAGGLPVAPSFAAGLASAGVASRTSTVGPRVVLMGAFAVVLGLIAGVVANVLTVLIDLITNLSFYGRVDTHFASPAGNQLGPWVVGVPVVGGLVVGVMARYGSRAIRGHGIPEAMEQVLFNRSRIPARLTFLKPLSAAVAIGTGGPFGAEGPIIATGGSLGSLLGQLIRVTAHERKTLLASGAAAGMAATFGSPVSAVLLAIELLLFEYRARSLIPVALAAVAATGVRLATVGNRAPFAMAEIAEPGGAALALYVVIGAISGLASVGVTRAVYAVEDLFEKLPIHWMWWPALGAIPVGIVGFFAPRTLGVGYDNIEQIVRGELVGAAVLVLCTLKFLSWVIALGSGTSGGTLAPVFTFGGGLGSLLAMGFALITPAAGVDIRVGALVGMASMFAGASRAVLASVVFAFETTRQPMGLLPLLGGCSAAYLISILLMRHSIMTEKIARRGARVPDQYAADYLEQVLAGQRATRPAITVGADEPLDEVRRRLSQGISHQGYPVIDAEGRPVGVLMRRDLFVDNGAATPGALIRRPPIVIREDDSLREAADRMLLGEVGRLPVVDGRGRVVGVLSRSDLIEAHRERLDELRVETGRWSRPRTASTG